MEANKENETIRRKPPSSITVHVQPRRGYEAYETRGQREIPKGLLAVLIVMGTLLVAGVIFVGVLLLMQTDHVQAVDKQPAVVQTADVQSAPTATFEQEKPSAAATEKPPVATTKPETSGDDLSSLFETPSNPILDDSQGQ